MTYRKIVLLSTLLCLFLINNPLYGKSKSKESIGNSLVESVIGKNINSFKSLLLPKEVVLKLKENDAPENKEDRDSLMTQYADAYDNMIIPRYENNFWEIVNLNETNEIDWSHLNFVLLYKGESKDQEYIPFFIHSKLNNSDYNHFYFGAVRYKGAWYLSGDMEITKDEKYAPYD